MDILTLRIREDLRKHNQNMRVQWTARWRWLQLLVLFFCLLIAFSSFLPLSLPLHQAMALVLFAPLLMLTGLQPFIYPLKRYKLLISFLTIIYLLIVIAAVILNPVGSVFQRVLSPWAIWLNLLIPFLSWCILIILFVRSPSQARQYSLRAQPVFMNILIGIGSGLALTLHLYMVAYFIPNIGQPLFQFNRDGLLWNLCLLIGIIVPAEELVFRGAAFSILYDELNSHFGEVMARVTALNIMVYLVVIVSNQSLHPFELLSLVYRAGLSAISLYFVMRLRSLLPGMLANLIFTLATGWLFAL